MDDILLAVSSDSYDTVSKIFNLFHKSNHRIKFTIEVSGSDMINFLDVCVIREGDVLIFDLFQNPFRVDI